MKLQNIIIEEVQLLLEELGEEQVSDLESKVLYGADGILSSLSLVRLIVSIENRIFENEGLHINLTDEKALSMRNSPFRSISALRSLVDDKRKEAIEKMHRS